VASEELLLKVVNVHQGRSVGLSYDEILTRVREEFPDCNTSVACLRWYCVQLRERGESVPMRPRKTR
jgi:hypothetical protein